ncbi:hypothetical protein ACFWXK_01525 [Streptomyces sp. NPDC059070]|uniref:hypothetical protein n=1 Tax=Streptomyces sp. NPDC059070 TaxID=3346713 RepID=UPI0036AED365
MHALHPQPTTSGTPLLSAPASPTAETQLGYWYETLRYPTPHTAVPAVARLAMVSTAFRAVRTLRCDLRTSHVFALTARESRRAIIWADAGYVSALAVLAQGDPVGFTLSLRNGETAEWCIRPMHYLQLTPPGWCDPPRCTVTA